jgi:hypothetical protein
LDIVISAAIAIVITLFVLWTLEFLFTIVPNFNNLFETPISKEKLSVQALLAIYALVITITNSIVLYINTTDHNQQLISAFLAQQSTIQEGNTEMEQKSAQIPVDEETE